MASPGRQRNCVHMRRLRYERWPEYRTALSLAKLCDEIMCRDPYNVHSRELTTLSEAVLIGISRASYELTRRHSVETLEFTQLRCRHMVARLDRLRESKYADPARIGAAAELIERVLAGITARHAELSARLR